MATAAAFLDIGIWFIWGGGGGGGVIMSLIPPTKLWFNPTYCKSLDFYHGSVNILSIFLFACMYLFLSVHLFICLCLSACLYVCLSACLSTRLSVS